MCRRAKFGPIDKEGREVLPPIYESIDWDCRHGVACVSYDGKIGLYDRNGDESGRAPVYDWMGDVRESELAAGSQGRSLRLYPPFGRSGDSVAV
ncbi:MAG: WG repeat-containing protein [Alistipes indistinctus]